MYLGPVVFQASPLDPDGEIELSDHTRLRTSANPPPGVAANAQGRGIGSELLKHTLALLDASATLAYLECSTERNVALYRRHGFEVTGEFDLRKLHMWTMAREPQR